MSYKIKKELQKIFETRVVDDRFLTNEGFGLSVTLQGRGAISISPIFSNHAANDLKKIVESCGVLVVRNAFVGMLPTHSASLSINDKGKLQQDPFHIDYKFELGCGDPKTTALYSPLCMERLTPTFYARADAVKKAIAQLARDCSLGPDVIEALNTMASPNYYFSISLREKPARETILQNFPAFTQDVFNIVPPEQKYAHYWRAGERAVVLHPNKGLHIVHGRPESDTDHLQHLQAVLF